MANINKLPLGYFTMDFVDFEMYLQSLDASCILPMPDVHYEMCEWTQYHYENGTKRKLGLAPRSIAKTTLWGRHWPLWRLMRDPETCLLLYSADSELAGDNCASIQRLILNVPICERLIPENHKDQWTKHAFRVRGNNPMRREPSVYAKGILSSVVGQHPDEILGDDLEIDKNVTNDKRRKGVKKKISELNEVSPYQFLWGTYWTQDSAYLYCQNELNFETRTWRLYEPFNTGEETKEEIKSYIWPERWQYEDFAAMKTGGTAWFKSQYGLIPTAAWESKFQLKNIIAYSGEIEFIPNKWNPNVPGELKYFNGKEYERIYQCVAGWDTAEGSDDGDDSVLTVVFRTKAGYYVHEQIVLPETTADEGYEAQCKVVLEACKKYYVQELFIEDNYQKHLKADCIRIAKQLNEKLPVEKQITLPSITPFPQSVNKFVRIAKTLQPIVDGANLFCHEDVLGMNDFDLPTSMLWNEFCEFPNNTRSPNCLDSLEIAVRFVIDIPEHHGDLQENISPRQSFLAEEYTAVDYSEDTVFEERDMSFGEERVT